MKRKIKKIAVRSMSFLRRHPRLFALAKRIMGHFPRMNARMKLWELGAPPHARIRYEDLPPRARDLFEALSAMFPKEEGGVPE